MGARALARSRPRYLFAAQPSCHTLEGVFTTPKSRTQTKQSPSGWLKLFRLMRVIIRQNRATEIGDIDDDQVEILTEAKISAKANQQQHKVIEINGSLDFEQILIAINSK